MFVIDRAIDNEALNQKLWEVKKNNIGLLQLLEFNDRYIDWYGFFFYYDQYLVVEFVIHVSLL